MTLLVLLACDVDGDGFPDAVDCSVDNVDIFPGQAETCDGLDNDCDGRVDEDPVDGTLFGWDADGDGFGGSNQQVACDVPEGFVAQLGDCDDANDKSFPGAEERCDGYDNDCDGVAEDPPVPWYPDTDGDGFGDGEIAVYSCAAIYGHTTDGSDCDDDRPGAYPGAYERCNGADDDCDESVDEEAIDAPSWAPDGDGDGFGDITEGVVSCEVVEGSVDNADDCDDEDRDIFPWADEICGDGIDQDCNGVADNTCTVTWNAVSDAAVWLESDTHHALRRLVIADMDDDGDDDVIAGWHQDGGAVVIASAPLEGVVPYAPDLLGDNASDFGYELARVGEQLAVSAPRQDEVGAVYLFSLPGLELEATLWGAREDAALGRFGLEGGDLDGDDIADVVASSAEDDATFVFMGPLTADRSTDDADALVKATGFEQLAVGDLNGDGIDDLVSPYRTLSEVYGWYGPLSGEQPTSAADILIVGAASDYFGGAVAIGDHDGDGHNDLAVSGYYNSTLATQAGSVWVFDGPQQTESLQLAHTESYAYLGSYNSGAVDLADLNHDGRADLLASAASDDLNTNNSGTVVIVHGSLGGGVVSTEEADVLITGGYYSFCGYGLGVGDVTGDEVHDLAISCYGYAGTAQGAVSEHGFVTVLEGPLF